MTQELRLTVAYPDTLFGNKTQHAGYHMAAFDLEDPICGEIVDKDNAYIIDFMKGYLLARTHGNCEKHIFELFKEHKLGIKNRQFKGNILTMTFARPDSMDSALESMLQDRVHQIIKDAHNKLPAIPFINLVTQECKL